MVASSNAPETLAGPSYASHTVPSSWRWRAAAAKLKHAWLTTQISHRGKYSIERLVALDEYVRSTSWARVVFVCLTTPLPVIALVLSQESVPLQDPVEGWRVNFGVWIRAGVVAAVVSHTILGQLQHLVEDVAISRRQLAVILAVLALGYPAVSIVVADKVCFPIPFMSITMSPAFFLLLGCSFYFAVGGEIVRQIRRHQGQILRFAVLIAAQTLMLLVYPSHQALFQAVADSGLEILVIALLPILKAILKNIVSLSFYRMHDLMPEGVIFTVDFFNAFYTATSMQNTSSTTTVVVIMAVDLFNTVLALNSLHQGVVRIIELHQKAGTLRNTDSRTFNLLHTACMLCRNSDEFEMQSCTGVQLRSCLAYRLSGASQDLLERLDKYPGYQPHTRSSISYVSGRVSTRTDTTKITKKRRWHCGSRRSATIQPILVTSAPNKRSSFGTKSNDFTAGPFRRSELRQTLEILFTSECLVLSEYLESIVPLLYANYIMVMVHLPSARYHTEMTGITSDNVDKKVQAVFAYALLEFISFLVMVLVVQRKCGIKILHHLAFVLETHALLIQDKLMTWTLLTLMSRVVHFGFDFTFQFAWLA